MHRGLTLIEVLVVIGMLVIVASLGLFASLDSLRGNTFRVGRDATVTALMRARAEAINNVCFGASCADGKPHGVQLELDSLGALTRAVVFQGSVYSQNDPLNETIDIGKNVTKTVRISGMNTVVFTQLSAQPTATGTITLSDGVSSSTITIGREGQITWTN